MKSRLWMFFIPVLLIFVFVIAFNHSVVLVHLNELSNAVDELNRKQSGFNTIDILFKYEINRRLYSGLITEAEYDREELKTISILMQQEEQETHLNTLDYISLPAINALRFLLGKTLISPIEKQKKDNAALSLAFYHENNRRFRDALNIYETFDNREKQPSVLLHEGYCLSLLGEFANAKDKLTRIINENRNEEIAATATILLMYITDFKQEADYLIGSANGDDIETVVKLVQLNSFQNAQAMLDRLEKSNADDEVQAKIAYYRGRLLEESGEKSRALETYQELILEYYRYEAAKNANRRILVMSVNRPDRKKINALAIENNKMLHDADFESILELNENVGAATADNEAERDETIDDDLLNKLVKKSTEKREYLETQAVNAQLAELAEKEALEQQRQDEIKKQKRQRAEQERKRAKDLQLKRERERKKAQAAQRQRATAAAQLQKKKVQDNGDFNIEYYRKDGKLSQVDQFNKAGKKTGYLKYVYDENGNRIRIDTYDENDQLVEYY